MRVLAGLVALGLACMGTIPLGARELTLTAKGPEQTLFDTRVDSCDSSDLPDAPARAFRGPAGQIVMFVPNFRARAFEGPSLGQLTRDCSTRFLAAGSAEPNRLDDRTWLHAFATLPSGEIFAFGSAAFMPYRHGQKCRVGEGRTACWYNGIVALHSRDGGRTFQYQGEPPAHVVFPPPEAYRDDVRSPPGFITITNIVREGGYRYALAWYRDRTLAKSRNCLVRAPADDLSRWSIKTTESFREVARFDQGGWRTTPVECEGVGQGVLGTVRAIVFHPETKRFVAVFFRSNRSKPELSGIYYSTSPDLVAWSEAKLFYQAEHMTRENLDDLEGSANEIIAYPTVIDERSSDPDFGTTGSAPSLIITKIGRDRDSGSKPRTYRKIVAVPLELTRRP